MKIKYLLPVCLSFAFTLLYTVCTPAAPITPLGPIIMSGTVQTALWIPEKVVKGIAERSGSLGQDRVIPAYFIITLNPYKGVDVKTAIRMIQYVDWSAAQSLPEDIKPPFLKIRINSNDKNEFYPGLVIEVKDYIVKGDEGGAWTQYSSINIIK